MGSKTQWLPNVLGKLRALQDFRYVQESFQKSSQVEATILKHISQERYDGIYVNLCTFCRKVWELRGVSI